MTGVLNAVRTVPSLASRPMFREFWWLSAGTHLAMVLSQLTTLLLVRTVAKVEVGQVVFAQSTAVLVFLVLDPRFEDAVQRYVPLLRQESEARARALYWRMVRWDVALGTVTTLLAAAAWFAGALPHTALCRPDLLALAFCAIGVGSVVGTLHAGYAVTDGLSALGRRTIVIAVATAAVTAAAVLRFGATGYLAAAVIGAAIQVVVLAPHCVRRLRPVTVPAGEPPVDRSLPTGFGRFVLASSFGTALSVGTESGMLAAAGVSGGPELVALLKVAGAPGRMVLSLLSPIATQVFPRLSKSAAAGDLAGFRATAMRTSRAVLLPAVLAVVTSSVAMAPAIGLLYGERYRPAAGVAVFFVVAACLRGVVLWSKVLPLAAGRPGLRVGAVGVESVVVLVIALSVPWVVAGAAPAAFGIATGIVVLTAALAAFWWWTARRPDLLAERCADRAG